MRNKTTSVCARICLSALAVMAAGAQDNPVHPTTVPHVALPPTPTPLGVPKPGPATDAPYAPQPILQGGVVVTLYPPGSPYLKLDRSTRPSSTT